MKYLCALLVFALPLAAQRKPGSQLDHLPPNIEVLTHFGERADISPDNQRVAFMAKSFGDAMVIDLKTPRHPLPHLQRARRGVPARDAPRLTGDYILIGPDHFEDIHVSRTRDNELWFLSKERGSKPVKLGEKMSEGRRHLEEEPEDRLLADPRARRRRFRPERRA